MDPPPGGAFRLNFHTFWVKNRFWAVFFDVPFSASFFYRFLPAPGYPKTMKIKQNHCSVARNQGLAKVEKTMSWDHFWLRFGGVFGASERHVRFFWCFWAFCFSVLFFSYTKTCKYTKQLGCRVPCLPPKRQALAWVFDIKSKQKPGETNKRLRPGMLPGMVADTRIKRLRKSTIIQIPAATPPPCLDRASSE